MVRVVHFQASLNRKEKELDKIRRAFRSKVHQSKPAIKRGIQMSSNLQVSALCNHCVALHLARSPVKPADIATLRHCGSVQRADGRRARWNEDVSVRSRQPTRCW